MNKIQTKYYNSLHQTALKAPSKSGVYLWFSPKNAVIYVGKAKNLKNRLSSYFHAAPDKKTSILVSSAARIEYITTENEYEAFLLENILIKKHSPRYNICLKDSSSYPVIRITHEKFPRVYKTRLLVKDGSLYFGPYPDVASLDSFLHALHLTFPLRRCKKLKKTACLYYHIHECCAPCIQKIDEESYMNMVGEIVSLLKGINKKALTKMENKMKDAAKNMNFEKAASLRDGLKAFKIMNARNIVEQFSDTDSDYIAHYQSGERISFVVLKVRSGKMNARDVIRTRSLTESENLTAEFIKAYYKEKEEIPARIYVEEERDTEFLNEYLSLTFEKKIRVTSLAAKYKNKESLTKGALSGVKLHMAALEMAKSNAKEDFLRMEREECDEEALKELKAVLHLTTLPRRIEGFDIAHLSGKFTVASLISFYNGNPDKKNYRYFRLKTTDGIIDDFASMREASARRYTRLLNEKKELPDLIMIDGGIGQVNAVEGILLSIGLEIPIVGLAKRNEELWLPHASHAIVLPGSSAALRLLQRVRDETHRFATSRNQTLRTKENTLSIFRNIKGIGEKRSKILETHFVTLENLCASSVENIQSALKINAEAARHLLEEAKILLSSRNEALKEKRKEFTSL